MFKLTVKCILGVVFVALLGCIFNFFLPHTLPAHLSVVTWKNIVLKATCMSLLILNERGK